MPRKPQPWFRFYVEAMSDAKVRRIPASQRWVWAGAMSAAKESPQPGRLIIAGTDLPMTVGDLASYCDVREKDTAAAVQLMVRLGMLAFDGDVMVVSKFNSRQFLSDDVTGRVREHRERSKEQPLERSYEQPLEQGSSRARGRAGSRATRDTDTDLRTSKGSPTVPAGSLAQVVRAYFDSGQAVGMPTPEASQSKVERSARKLLDEGFPLDDVIEAAKNAAVGGWTDLAAQLQRDAARASPAATGPDESTTDRRFAQSVDIGRQVAAELAQLDQPERRALG